MLNAKAAAEEEYLAEMHGAEVYGEYAARWGGALQLYGPRVHRTCFQRLKLKYDEPLSNFGFNFKLRQYSEGAAAGAQRGGRRRAAPGRWYRLTNITT